MQDGRDDPSSTNINNSDSECHSPKKKEFDEDGRGFEQTHAQTHGQTQTQKQTQKQRKVYGTSGGVQMSGTYERILRFLVLGFLDMFRYV